MLFISTIRPDFYILVYMNSVLVQLDAETMAQLDQVAPPRNRARTEFIRRAIKAALHRSEFDRIRDAYLLQPDSAAEADDWSDPLEWKPESTQE